MSKKRTAKQQVCPERTNEEIRKVLRKVLGVGYKLDPKLTPCKVDDVDRLAKRHLKRKKGSIEIAVHNAWIRVCVTAPHRISIRGYVAPGYELSQVEAHIATCFKKQTQLTERMKETMLLPDSFKKISPTTFKKRQSQAKRSGTHPVPIAHVRRFPTHNRAPAQRYAHQ